MNKHTQTDVGGQVRAESTSNRTGDLDIEASSTFQELLGLRERAAQASRQVVHVMYHVYVTEEKTVL
jgi:hypothetical protein